MLNCNSSTVHSRNITASYCSWFIASTGLECLAHSICSASGWVYQWHCSLPYHHRHVFGEPAEKLLPNLLPSPLSCPVASQSCQCLCRKQVPTLECWQSKTVCTERVSDTTCTTAANRLALFEVRLVVAKQISSKWLYSLFLPILYLRRREWKGRRWLCCWYEMLWLGDGLHDLHSSMTQCNSIHMVWMN